MECMPSELDLFSQHPVQTSILRTEKVAYRPVNSLIGASAIEFASLGSNDTYRNLNSIYLRLRVKLMKDATNAVHTDATGGVVNNIMHSLFRNCTIQLNGTTICTGDNYHMRSYFENLLNYGNEAAQTHLEGSGWSLDTPGELDNTDQTKNLGLGVRAKWFAKSNEVELYSKLHADVLNQNKYLLNNIDLRIILGLESPSFYCLEKDTDTSYINILEAVLYIDHIHVNPSVLLAHNKVLQHRNIFYPYKKIEMKSFTCPAGGSSINIDNLVLGQLPNMVLLAMVENAAYTGQRSKNPFNFQHFNLASVNFVANGVKIPNDGILCDFSNAEAPIATHVYQSLFQSTSMHKLDRTHQITKEFFTKGCMILGADLTSDINSDICRSLGSTGTLRAELRFKTPLTSTITIIAYTEYDATVVVDSNRNVFVT